MAWAHFCMRALPIATFYDGLTTPLLGYDPAHGVTVQQLLPWACMLHMAQRNIADLAKFYPRLRNM